MRPAEMRRHFREIEKNMPSLSDIGMSEAEYESIKAGHIPETHNHAPIPPNSLKPAPLATVWEEDTTPKKTPKKRGAGLPTATHSPAFPLQRFKHIEVAPKGTEIEEATLLVSLSGAHEIGRYFLDTAQQKMKFLMQRDLDLARNKISQTGLVAPFYTTEQRLDDVATEISEFLIEKNFSLYETILFFTTFLKRTLFDLLDEDCIEENAAILLQEETKQEENVEGTQHPSTEQEDEDDFMPDKSCTEENEATQHSSTAQKIEGESAQTKAIPQPSLKEQK